MALENINKLLERIKKISPPEIFIRKEFQKEVEKILNISLKTKEIKYSGKNKIIYLKTSPSIKTEIFFNKEKILNSLKERLGKKSPENIL